MRSPTDGFLILLKASATIRSRGPRDRNSALTK